MSARKRRDPGAGEVLIEIRRVGSCVRVAAIDPVTATEVCVSGSSRGDPEALTRVAIRKLHYVLARRDRRPARSFFA